jgi:hypothetical protein
MSAPPQNGLLLPGVVSAACQGTEPVSAVQFWPAGQMMRPGVVGVAIRPHRQVLCTELGSLIVNIYSVNLYL